MLKYADFGNYCMFECAICYFVHYPHHFIQSNHERLAVCFFYATFADEMKKMNCDYGYTILFVL